MPQVPVPRLSPHTIRAYRADIAIFAIYHQLMRVLITGGAGFIGSHIVDAVIRDGHEPVVYDALLPDVHPALIRGWPDYVPEVTRVRGDVRDADAVESALRGTDLVFHQAAKVGLGVDSQDAPAYCEHNVVGTAQLLAAMSRAGVRRLVLASSMVVYGEGSYVCPVDGPVQPGPRRRDDLAAGNFEPPCPACGRPLQWREITEDAPTDPRNTYATTKVAQEQLAASWARENEAQAIALRYHNVYGPRMPRDTPYAGVASLFRSALEAGRAPSVFEDGHQRRDFVHVSDVAAANVAAMEGILGSAQAFRAYNVASGTTHTIGDMARALSDAVGGPTPVVTGDYRLGDVRHIVASAQRAERELGYAANVDFATGMQDFAVAPLR